jgi:hypothetical protein
VIVTIVVVAYVLVPSVARFLGAVGGYNPASYEPKDLARESWLDARGQVVGLPGVSREMVVNILLFLMVVVVWLALVPPGASRRR